MGDNSNLVVGRKVIRREGKGRAGRRTKLVVSSGTGGSMI